MTATVAVIPYNVSPVIDSSCTTQSVRCIEIDGSMIVMMMLIVTMMVVIVIIMDTMIVMIVMIMVMMMLAVDDDDDDDNWKCIMYRVRW